MPPDKLADLSFDLLVAGALTLAFAFVSDVVAAALASQARRAPALARGLVPAPAGAGAGGTVTVGEGSGGSGASFASGPRVGLGVGLGVGLLSGGPGAGA